ncbi:MAG: ABC transporter permease [Burkholderiales bacterium]|nr:ABC transporter permease [Burkholderiales bacterium]
MDAKRPNDAELKALKEGARELAEGQQELGKGLAQLTAGGHRLTEGFVQLQDATSGMLLGGERVSEAASELHGGATQLTAGLEKAQAANMSLTAGAARIDEGVGKLTEGVGRAGGTMQSIASKIPEDAKIDALNTGAKQMASGSTQLANSAHRLHDGTTALASGLKQLNEGSGRLSSGLNAIAASLPTQVNEMEGTAPGLANSVVPSVEVAAPVANNGTGFAPGFITLALWVGAVMTAFLFQFNRIPASQKGAPRISYVLGKLVIPVCIVLLQAEVMFLTLIYVLHVHVPDVYTFLLTLATASLVFLLVVMALVRLLGDLGKFAAVFLLIVQLSAAGSLMPIELTGKFFQVIHPYLPFTWVVRAFRAVMFGAFDGDWMSAWLIIIGIGGIALLIALFAWQWKFVREEDYRPPVEI